MQVLQTLDERFANLVDWPYRPRYVTRELAEIVDAFVREGTKP